MMSRFRSTGNWPRPTDILRDWDWPKTVKNTDYRSLIFTTIFQRFIGDITKFFGIELPNSTGGIDSKLQPTVGVSFGLPNQESNHYGNQQQNFLGTGASTNPYPTTGGFSIGELYERFVWIEEAAFSINSQFNNVKNFMKSHIFCYLLLRDFYYINLIPHGSPMIEFMI